MLGLSYENDHEAQESSEIEADDDNNVKETVEQIKHLETIAVFDNIAETKSKPEDDIEYTRDISDTLGVTHKAHSSLDMRVTMLTSWD